jgi:O-antigen/teichoic acid export membrane protein
MSIRKYSILNFIGSVIPLLVIFVTTPIYIRLLGELNYGILCLIWVFISYFAFMDFGTGRSLANLIVSKAHKKQSSNELFWSGFYFTLCVSLLLTPVIFFLLKFIFFYKLNLSEDLQKEIQLAIPALLVVIPVVSLTTFFAGALQGHKKIKEINIFQAINFALTQIIPLLIFHFYDKKLSIIIYSIVCIRILSVLYMWIICIKLFPSGRSYFNNFSYIKNIGGLLKHGGWLTISNLLAPFLISLDRFIIGIFLGASYVSIYTIPYQLLSKISIAPLAITEALFVSIPRNSEKSIQLEREGILNISFIVTPIVFILIALMPFILTFWISKDFSNKASTLSIILLLAFWTNTFAYVPFIKLQAMNKYNLIAKAHLFEIFPYLILVYLAIKSYGLVGVALAALFRCSLDLILLVKLSKLRNEIIKPIISSASILALAIFFYLFVEISLLSIFFLFLILALWVYINITIPFKRFIKDIL